jgi:hypothetical protein
MAPLRDSLEGRSRGQDVIPIQHTAGNDECQHSRSQSDECENHAAGYWNRWLPQHDESLLPDDWQEEPDLPDPCRKKDEKHAH